VKGANPFLLYTVHSDLLLIRKNNKTIKISYNEATFDICDSVKTCMDSLLVNCTMDIGRNCECTDGAAT
jgi:hypothetical protein